MRDVVVVSLEKWDEVWRRNQHLVAGLLRDRSVGHVLFVEPAADPIHALRRRKKPERGVGLRMVDDVPGIGARRLWAYQPTKWLPRKLAPKADARWAADVQRQTASLNFVNPLLWVNDPLGAELLDTRWPALYDVTDDWLLAHRPDSELARLQRQEAHLLAECDTVVVCSAALVQTKSEHREVVHIPNAVDLEPYQSRQPRPGDLPPGPVAIYLGTAHRDRIDVELCLATAEHLARERSGVLVLVGPAPLPFGDLERLRRAGVHVLGPRPSKIVPSYLQHADVLVVPHVITKFTKSLDPIKAYEYRAARRPVISTPVPGFIDVPDPLVQSVSPADFPEVVSITAAAQVPWSGDLPDDIPAWSQRVDQMSRVIRRLGES